MWTCLVEQTWWKSSRLFLFLAVSADFLGEESKLKSYSNSDDGDNHCINKQGQQTATLGKIWLDV